MQRILASVIILIFIMSVIFWAAVAPSHGAHSDSACAACHSEEVEEAQTHLYVHAPFLDGKCGTCHIPSAEEETPDSEAPESANPQDEAPTDAKPEKIAAVDVNWLYEYFEPVQNLLLPLRTDEVEKTLVVEIWDQCRGEHQHVVPLPPLQQARPLPPRVRGKVRIPTLNITRAPHRPDTVVVECRTNVPVRGELRLHQEDGRVRTLSTPQGFQSHMEMRIQGLRSKTRYKLEFVYAGVDGTKKRSAVHTFIPAQLALQSQSADAGEERPCRLDADIRVFRGECDTGACYFLSVAVNQPVTLSVGALKSGADIPARLRPAGASTSAPEKGNSAAQQGSRFHSDMADARYINYESCRPCHAEYFSSLTHPVDVTPGVGMEVPSEVPLLDNGRMSCMTCHVFHADDDFYRLRFASKQKLCQACHDEY